MIFDLISIPALICFIAGMALFIVEMFTPGLGVPALLGSILLIASIILQAHSVVEGLILFIIIVALLAILFIVFSHSARKGFLTKTPVILQDKMDQQQSAMEQLVGQSGMTLTDLRPSGSARIDGQKYDVLACGEFIPKDTPIYVVSADDMKIVVERLDK